MASASLQMRIARLFPISALALAGAACRDAGARTTFSEPETVSAATTVGAAPMFALSPAGKRAVAWVSAPGGGTDGRLYVSTDGAPSELRDSLGPIEPHGEAPPKLSYGPNGTLYALYAVGKVVPGRRFPMSALRLAKSADDGKTWNAPVTIASDSAFGTRNFHALHVGGDGALYVAWLESAAGQVENVPHAVERRGHDLDDACAGRCQPVMPVLPNSDRDGARRHALPRVANRFPRQRSRDRRRPIG